MFAGLFNPGLRCWFNAAFQAWTAAGYALARSDAAIPAPTTRYEELLRAAIYETSPNRADPFFEEFAKKFFANLSEASGQHDPVAAFCAIAAHTQNSELRVQFLGLTIREVTCSRCHTRTTTKFPEPLYGCTDLSVLSSAEKLTAHLQGGVQTIIGVEIPGCSCPAGTPQSLKETHKLPRILVLAVNRCEPAPEKAAIPRAFQTPTHHHELIAAICKSGQPSGGHCWAYVKDITSSQWWSCNDYNISPADGPDANIIAGIYWRH
jgi:Ubiquitin carboxyl-terminal hydrolase